MSPPATSVETLIVKTVMLCCGVDGGCMDGRARWYRLRMCRPASYHQHSRSASFDAGGSGGPTTDYHGAQDEAGDEAAGTGGSGRRRTTPIGHSTTRAPSGAGRAAATAALHSPTADVITTSTYSYTFLRCVVCLSVCRLSHSCTLLEPFDGFRCHLTGAVVGSSDTSC